MENLQKGIKQGGGRIVQIFEMHYQSMLLFGGGVCSDNNLVKDCIQDLFLKFCENQDLILEARNQEAYLKASLRREILRKVKKSEMSSSRTSQIREIAVPSYEDILIKKQKSLQDALNVKEALSQLTKSQKTILTLRFYRSMSYDEIAEKLEITKRTVYNQVHDSMKKLKSILPR